MDAQVRRVQTVFSDKIGDFLNLARCAEMMAMDEGVKAALTYEDESILGVN